MRIVVGLILCLLGGALAFVATQPQWRRGPSLALTKVQVNQRSTAPIPTRGARPAGVVLPIPSITFGHPIISGIGGTGFEQDLRIDPSNPNRIYTSAPGSTGADTSWIWRSLDAGRTFKWIPNATAQEGKVTTCHGGGDTELAIDNAGRIYFNDLTLANFSTGRSDDFGVTFTCSNTGVPDTAVDRQWYAIDGDPLNGGSLYLTNDEIGPGGGMCGGSVGNNVLVMYRSPALGLGATAGIEFGPAYHVTDIGSCDEAIMGNNELSPVATTLGQPDALGGYATLATPAKHVFVVHDNAELNKILIGRCFPVAFGAPVANVSDPSGLNCSDLLVADLGANAKTGANFPTMAIDSAGNVYTVWEQAPLTAGVISGDVVLMFSYSTDQGNTWSTPQQIDTSGSPVGTLRENIFAWMSAGDDGRVNIVWYGTPDTATSGSFGPDDCNTCSWSVWMTQSLNAHSASPVFTPPILASEHPVHYGNVQTLIGGQNQLSSRALGDFLQLRTGARGEAHISYGDTNNIIGSAVGHGIYLRQDSGPGLYAATSPVNVPGIAAFNGATDPAGDGKFEANGIVSANMPQLDILGSNISKVMTAPCSAAAPCYRVEMQLNNLSLAPTLAQDPDTDLVWSTQWLIPSTTDAAGGKNFHVYAESNNGAALQCYVGENAVFLVGGGAALSYPGNTTLPAANCQSTLGPNGTITIYVPLSLVDEPGAIDRRLHEVTASTMTLTQPANTNPSLGGIGGSLFDLIDVAQGYVFDPALAGAVSRKTHPGAGTFDVPLPLFGTPGIECRRGQGTSFDNHQVVVTFAAPVTFNLAKVTGGTGSVASTTTGGNQVTINLTGVANAQTITITLFDVNDGTGAGNVSIPMSLLLGDTTADGAVNAADISQTKSVSGTSANGTTFRRDVTVNGAIDAPDVSLVKSKSGTILP